MPRKSPGLPKSPPRRGPYLCAAMLAENVLQDKDSVPSVIRIIDKMMWPRNVEIPAKGTAIALTLHLVVLFKTGKAHGEFPVSFVQVGPSKERIHLATAQLVFDATKSGTLSDSQLNIVWDGFGQYWLDLFIKDRFCTTVPLEIRRGTPGGSGNARGSS